MTTTPHGQVPEALRLANVCSNLTRYSMDAHLIAGELRRQHTRIAELESELEAVGAGGVQALSAAPVAFLKSVIALCSHCGYSPANIEVWDKDDKWIADLWRQAESMLTTSPTPPAEQQTQPDECFPGEPKVAVPQGLIGAACFAIRNNRNGSKVLEQLRRYSVGDQSQPLAPQPSPTPQAADNVQEEAARYRLLRRCKGQEHEPPFTVQHEIDGTLWGGDLDAAIDSARKQGTNHD